MNVKKKSNSNDIEKDRIFQQKNICLPKIKTNLKFENSVINSYTRKRNSANECLITSDIQPRNLFIDHCNDYIKDLLKKDMFNKKKSSNKFDRIPPDTNDLANKNFDNCLSSHLSSGINDKNKTEKSFIISTKESSKVYQFNSSPYFWYYRDKTNFFPQKSYNTPPLESFKLSEPLNDSTNEKSFSNESINKSLNDSKISRRMEIAENYKNFRKNKKQQKEKKYKEKRDCNKSGLPKIKRKLTSAKLRKLAVSEKFIQEAKLTVYMPHSHSFYPLYI